MHETGSEPMIERLLEQNAELAKHNQEHFEQLGMLALNFMSAPGAGKTTLIGATATALKDSLTFCIIEGDMVGELDAQRLRQLQLPSYQISTGRACHLDAKLVARLLHKEVLPKTDVLIIENVGNLVCPAEFPLGEHLRIVLLSVSEGDDKPFKYPVIFHNCDAVILTKCDLLPHVDFDTARASRYIRDLNPHARIFQISTQTGEGMTDWTDWLVSAVNEHTTELSTEDIGHVSLPAG
jgi:hydrogenase nickel incorporation protein HypB